MAAQVVEKRFRGSQCKAKMAEKAEFMVINEHFEAIFNAAVATHDCMDAGGRATQEAKAEIVFKQLASYKRPFSVTCASRCY